MKIDTKMDGLPDLGDGVLPVEPGVKLYHTAEEYIKTKRAYFASFTPISDEDLDIRTSIKDMIPILNNKRVDLIKAGKVNKDDKKIDYLKVKKLSNEHCELKNQPILRIKHAGQEVELKTQKEIEAAAGQAIADRIKFNHQLVKAAAENLVKSGFVLTPQGWVYAGAYLGQNKNKN